MSEITNTTERVKHDLMLGLEASLPGGIEAMEAKGQGEFVLSEALPTKMVGVTEDELAALGFVLGPAYDGDPLFRDAKLPEGWSKRPTDHDMWSDIIDAQGEVRFAVFYKAAFYDRRALVRPA